MDPYTMFAKAFATWLRIKVLMGFTIAWMIILMALSSWTTQSSGGGFGSIHFPSKNSYSDWYNDVCETAPYEYLSPFSFSYSYNGTTSSTNAYCPWPLANSVIRIIGTCSSILVLLFLYVKTPFSLLARIIFSGYALLFFALFVIDAGIQNEASIFCTNMFPHTDLSRDMSSVGMSITCSSTGESVIVVFDIIASALFFTLHSAWFYATDIYKQPNASKTAKPSSDRKALLSKKAGKSFNMSSAV